MDSRATATLGFESSKLPIGGLNNFHLYFLDDCPAGLARREKDVYKRFEQEHPELAEKATREIKTAVRSGESVPYNILNRAFGIMKEYVPHETHLTR